MSNIIFMLIFGAFASFFIGIAAVSSMIQFSKEKNLSSLYMAFVWLFFVAYSTIQTIGLTTGNEFLARLALVFLIPTAYFDVLLVDSVSRISVDPKKILLITAASAFFLYADYRPGGMVYAIKPDGVMESVATLDFIISQFILVLLMGIYMLHCFWNVYQHAPKKLKKIALINFLGMVFIAVIANIVVTLRLNRIIPSLHMLVIGTGSLLCSYAFWKQPKLAFILPFKALRLSVIETNSGLPLFTHDWIKNSKLANENILSSFLQGLSLVLDEAVNRGRIREIILDQGVIVLEQHKELPIVFALISTRTSQTLRDSLSRFSREFSKKFSHRLSNRKPGELIVSASELVPVCFPFIPEYE